MREELQNIKNEAIARITEAKTAKELEEIRIGYLGRSGKVSKLTKRLSELSKKERKQTGILLNDTKKIILSTIARQRNSLKESVREWFDATMPGTSPEIGSLHLITQAIEEISEVFKKIGFTRVRYPEVEWDWYAFEGLNFPPGHPARDDWETYWVDAPIDKRLGPMLLTPHTSSGQIREMERVGKPPIRMINIAKCFRRQSDVSHTPMFHQFEGLVIDRDISIAHLKGTLDFFSKNYFGPKRVTRLRPHNFPFTEPSFEVDIICDICEGKGCRLCKEGWVELAGAGMVHPKVLAAGGIDPKKYTAFAFGTGVERVLMMKSGIKIPDLRILYSPDLRFLRQF